MINGKDVASFQSETWDVSGDDFAVVKCTEGTGYVNPKYLAQIAHARAHGLVLGHYHFGHHGGAAEAAFFLRHVDLRPGDFIAYDWEASGATQADRDEFIAYVRQHRPGVKVVLYCNTDWWFNHDTESNAGDGLWIADIVPAGHPRVTHPWLIHQFSDAGGMDRDVANFPSRAAMHAWAAGTPVVTPPKPPAPKPAPTLSETSFAVKEMVSYAFSLKADAAMTVTEIGAACQDSKGVSHDFPPVAFNVTFKAGEELHFSTGSQALAAGVYTVFPAYKTVDGVWHNLTARQITV